MEHLLSNGAMISAVAIVLGDPNLNATITSNFDKKRRRLFTDLPYPPV